jgi:methionyl-tRNA formyltransferase
LRGFPGMNIVILTNYGSLYGKKICNSFVNKKIPIAAVVVVRQPFTYNLKLFSSVSKKVGIVDAVYFSLKRIASKFSDRRLSLDNNKLFKYRYHDLGIPVYFSEGTNSAKTLDILQRLSPDLLILGQTGIVKKQVLSIPKLGTLNGHPGMLPYYRGIDCAKWAIYHNDFNNIGCSVHWVDEHIDTGNIIMKKRYSLSQGEYIRSLDHNLYDLCVLLLTEVVLSLRSGKNMEAEPQKPAEGRQYYKMPRKLEKEVARKLHQFPK